MSCWKHASFPKEMLGLNIAPHKHLRATTLPLSHVNRRRFMQVKGMSMGRWISIADLCSEFKADSQFVPNSHTWQLTLLLSCCLIHSLFFSLWLKFLVYANSVTTTLHKICRSNLQFNCHFHGFKRQSILNQFPHLLFSDNSWYFQSQSRKFR